MIRVQGLGEARQGRGGALRGDRLGGGRGVAGEGRRGDVAGGLAAADLGEALRAELGAQAVQRAGSNVSGGRTGRAGARRRALRGVV